MPSTPPTRLLGVLIAIAVASSAAAQGVCAEGGAVLAFSDPGAYTVTVAGGPAESVRVAVSVRGADGGGLGNGTGGAGALVEASFSIPGGTMLDVYIGGKGVPDIITAGGGGGSALVADRAVLLTVAGAGGGGRGSVVGGGGLGLTDRPPGGGTQGRGAGGGGGFGSPGGGEPFGGGAGTLHGAGAGGAGTAAGGDGFGGGGGTEGGGGSGGSGGGGGYAGGSGGVTAPGEGGTSYVNVEAFGGTVLAVTPGGDGDGQDRDGAVTLTCSSAVAAVAPPGRDPSLEVWSHPARRGGQSVVRLDVPARQAVTLALYDALGRRVAVLFEGRAERDVRVALPSGLASGAYVLRVRGAGLDLARRVVVR